MNHWSPNLLEKLVTYMPARKLRLGEFDCSIVLNAPRSLASGGLAPASNGPFLGILSTKALPLLCALPSARRFSMSFPFAAHRPPPTSPFLPFPLPYAPVSLSSLLHTFSDTHQLESGFSSFCAIWACPRGFLQFSWRLKHRAKISRQART